MRAIVTYHSIDDSGSVISIEPAVFRAHMEWLANSGIEVLSLDALLRAPAGLNAIALTFDDGFKNFHSTAAPILRDHALSATVFLVSDRVGGTNKWSGNHARHIPELPLMSWTEIEQLAAAGVTFGSHTRTHPDLRLVTDEQLSDEIKGAAEAIHARTGRPVATFAFPYGSFDERAVRAVARVHVMACTTEFRPLRADDDATQLPRLDAYYFQRPNALERYGSSAFRRYIWLRAKGRRLRQALTLGAHA